MTINLVKEAHIAVFVPSLVGGGAERVILTLIQEFCDLGIRVDLILAKAQGVFLNQVPDSVRIYDCGTERVLYAVPKLIKYLRTERPKALLSAMEHANVAVGIAKLMSMVQVKLVFSTHTNIEKVIGNAKNFKEKLTKYWIFPFYHYADNIIAVSNGVAVGMARLLHLSKGKIKVIYNPIITKQLLAKAREEVTDIWLCDKTIPVIVAVGRLTAAKDYPTLIKAFSIVKAKVNIRMLILGEGELYKEISELISLQCQFDDSIKLLGFVDNPYSYIRAADLFVISSAWEGFGNVLVESLACGTKVVSTNYESGAAEILENGRWGVLVPVGDAGALANAILSSLNAGLPVGATESVMARFDSINIARQYLEVLLG